VNKDFQFTQSLHGRYVWSLAWTSLKVKIKGQGHQGQKLRPFQRLACSLCLLKHFWWALFTIQWQQY